MPRKNRTPKETITRYDFSEDDGCIIEDPSGKYVLYDEFCERMRFKFDVGLGKKMTAMTDHIAALQQKLYTLEAEEFCRKGKLNREANS